MEIDIYDHGVPSWIELGSPDIPAAQEFYGKLFGWEFEAGPPEAGGYVVGGVRGRPVAGIGRLQNPGPAAWLTYVNVDDADLTAKKAQENGGQVLVGPLDVLDIGRMALIADPQGAAIGVWEPGSHKGAGVVNEPNTWSWSELLTTDVEGAKRFYKAVFDWDARTSGEGAGAYTEWKVGERGVSGMMQKPADMPASVPPHWSVYFAVEDAAAAVKRFEELGGSIVMPLRDIEPGIFAVVADPQGAVYYLIQLHHD